MGDKKVILIDMDSTVVDLLTPWLRWYNTRWEDNLRVDDLWGMSLESSVKPECGKQIMDFLKEPGMMRSLNPYPGAVEAINAWHDAGHTILFTTDICIAGTTALDDKINWLKSHFPWVTPGLGTFFTGAGRGRIRADLLIDDKPANLEEFKKYNPNSAAWCIAFPFNEKCSGIVDLRAYGFQDPGAAWSEFAAALPSLGGETSRNVRCLTPLPNGELCPEIGCQRHFRVRAPSGSFYTREVWELAGHMVNDALLESVEFEVAYARKAVDDIVSDPALDPETKHALKLRALHEAREAVKDHIKTQVDMGELVHKSSVLGLVQQLLDIVKMEVSSDHEKMRITRQIKQLRLADVRKLGPAKRRS